MPPLFAFLFFFFLQGFIVYGTEDIIPNPDMVLGKPLPNVELIDEKGRSIKLKEFSEGKPLIISLFYTRCTSSCPVIIEGIEDALKGLREKNFKVLLIDFDERDTDTELRKFIENRNLNKNWDLAVAKGEALRKLTTSLDFKFSYDKDTDMFQHPNILVVVSPNLVVSGYMLGVRYDTDKLSKMVKKAAKGEVELSWVKGILLRCFRYDPITGAYTLDWTFISMLLGGLIPLSVMAYYILIKPFLKSVLRGVST